MLNVSRSRKDSYVYYVLASCRECGQPTQAHNGACHSYNETELACKSLKVSKTKRVFLRILWLPILVTGSNPPLACVRGQRASVHPHSRQGGS